MTNLHMKYTRTHIDDVQNYTHTHTYIIIINMNEYKIMAFARLKANRTHIDAKLYEAETIKKNFWLACVFFEKARKKYHSILCC